MLSSYNTPIIAMFDDDDKDELSAHALMIISNNNSTYDMFAGNVICAWHD